MKSVWLRCGKLRHMLSEIKILTRLKQWKGKSNPVCGQRVDETKAHRISFPFMLGHFHMSPLLSCPSITFYSGQDSCLGLKHIHSSAVHQIAPNTVILQSSWRRGWRGGRHKVSRRQSCVCEPSYFNPLNAPRLMMWSLYIWRTTSGKRPNVISCQSASDCVNAEVRASSQIIVVQLMKDEKLKVYVMKVCVCVHLPNT